MIIKKGMDNNMTKTLTFFLLLVGAFLGCSSSYALPFKNKRNHQNSQQAQQKISRGTNTEPMQKEIGTSTDSVEAATTTDDLPTAATISPNVAATEKDKEKEQAITATT